jgi:hypothetical protein
VNYKQNPQALTHALLELKQVKAVRTEYDYWVITLTNDLVIYLGEEFATEGTSWNDLGYSLEGFTETQNPKKVAEEFATWAKQQTKEGN